MIGFGDLGRALLSLLKPFSNEIMAFDPWVPDLYVKKFNVQPVDLITLLKKSDIVFVLASITSSNKAMIDLKKLKLMKNFSTIVIISRAEIINFNDLYKFLKSKSVYAAIDVFPEEPLPKNSQLRKLPNVLFSPHRAGALDVAFKEMGEIVLGDLKLITNNLPPRLCKRAERETVNHLRSKPVDIN